MLKTNNDISPMHSYNASRSSISSSLDDMKPPTTKLIQKISNTSSELATRNPSAVVDLGAETHTIITSQPQGLKMSAEDISGGVKKSNYDSDSYLNMIVPGVCKFINGLIEDHKSDLALQLGAIIEGNVLKNIDGNVKTQLDCIKREITEAKKTNDVEKINGLFEHALIILDSVGATFSSTEKSMLYHAFQGIKVRQPLLMGQTYWTAPILGPAGSVKLGLHINLVPPSILDNLMNTQANTDTHLQVFLHNELGGSVGLADLGKNVGCFGYGAVISHDGLDFTLTKNGKWSLGDPQLIVERVLRAESNIGLNNGGGNVQHTVGADYVSQRFFSCDNAGMRAAAHMVPKWVVGATTFGGVNAATGGCAVPLAAASAAFHATDQVTKYAGEHLECMKPDKEFRLVELATLSAPVDGGYTHSSGFGVRGMMRMNGGFGTLKNNNKNNNNLKNYENRPNTSPGTTVRHRSIGEFTV